MSNDRLPPVSRGQLSSSEQPTFDSLATLAGNLFGTPESSPFIYKHQGSDGAFVGPFPLMLVAPEVGEHAMALYGKLAKIPDFPADAKETAILTVGAHYKAGYETYSHVNVATKKVGMPSDVVKMVSQGEKPSSESSGWNEGCDVAFDVADYLSTKPGALPRELWDRSMKVFGKQGTAALIHYVGAYAYTCVMLNGMDCPVPEDPDSNY